MANDTLYDVLIGIDEGGSTSLMNQQLEKIGKGLKDLDVQVKLDKTFKDQVKSTFNKMKIDMPKGMIQLPGANLLAGHEENIKEALKAYEKFGYTVTKIAGDTKIGFQGLTLEVQDLQGNFSKITLDADLVEKSRTLFTGFEKGVKDYKVSLADLQKQLTAVYKTQAAGKGNEQTKEKEKQLITQLNTKYGEYINYINSATAASEVRKNQLVVEANLSAKTAEKNFENAKSVGQNMKAYANAEKSLETYKKRLKEIQDIQAGKNIGFTEKQIKQSMGGLKANIGKFDDLKQKMQELDIVQERTLKSQSMQRWEKQYTQSINNVEKELKQLETAYINLDYAETRGQTSNVDKQVAEIERLKKSIQQSGESALELGRKLGTIDDKTDIASLGIDFQKVETQMRDSAIQADVLNKKFGQILTTTKSGKGTKGLVEGFIGGPKTTKELKELGEAIFGVGTEFVKTTEDKTHFMQMSDKLTYSVKDQDGVWRRYTLTLDEANKELRQTEIATDQTKKSVEGFGNGIMDAAKKIATWGISTKIVYGTWRAFQEGIQTVKELDTQLTQIAIVQGEGRLATKLMGEEFVATAVKMAQSVQDVAMLNTELIRQGLNLTQAGERADTIMKLSSAGMVSMEQSLQVITTGVNALGEAHEKVADVILKASMLSASDVEGLGEAFTKTASGAKAAGLSIEETSALLATMKEVTQEGDSQLGTSLKSMLARFNKINEETGEMNEDLNKVQTAIESVGVEFLDSEGQIRSFYDIVQDLSAGWGDLDKNTQAYIATQAAGVRQQNRFFALMDNFNKVQAINNDLTNSAGTLQRSYATYLDSSEAASKRLQASLDQLWMNFIDSDVIIGLTNVATLLVKMVDFLGPLSLAFMALSVKIALSTAVMKEFFASAVKGVLPAATGMEVLRLSVVNLKGAITAAGIGMKTFGKTLIAVLPTMAAFMLAGWAIGKLVTAVTDYTQSIKALKQAQVDYYNETIKMVQSQHTQEATIDDLGNEYLALSSKIRVAGGIYALTTEELDRYYAVQQDLKGIIPSLTSYEDERGRTILTGVNSVEGLTDAYRELIKIQLDQAAIGYQERINETLKEKNKLIDETIDKQRELLKDENSGPMMEGVIGLKYPGLSDEEIAKEKGVYEEWRVLEKARLQEVQRRSEEIITALRVKMLSEFGEIPNELSLLLSQAPIAFEISQLPPEEMMNYVRNLKNNLDLALQGANFGEGLNSISDVFAEVERLGQEHVEGIINTEEYQAKMSSLIEGLKAVAGTSTEEVKTMVEGAIEALSVMGTEAPQVAEDVADALAKVREESLDDAAAAYEASSQAAQDYYADLQTLNDAETTSTQIQDMVLSKYPEWAYMMNDKAALSQAFEAAMRAEDQTRAESYMNMLLNTDSFTQATGGAYQQLMTALGHYYEGDISNYNQLEGVKAKITESLINELNSAWGAYFHEVDGYIEVNRKAVVSAINMSSSGFTDAAQAQAFINAQVSKLEVHAAAARKQVKTMTNAVDTFKASIDVPDFKSFAKDLSGIGAAGKKAGAGGKSAADGAKAAEDAAKAAAEALKEYNEAMKATQDATKEVFDFALEYIEWIEEQKREAMEKTFEDAEKAAEEAYDTVADTLEKEKEAQLEVLDIKEKNIKAEDELLEYLKKRQELQEGIVDLEYQIAIASFDSTVGGVKRRRELEEALAEERKQLAETEEERLKRMEEEAYARERAFIESQAEWERIQAEETKNSRIANAQTVFDREKILLDQKYSDENKYLLAKQATQSGMIANLQGEMIPLVAAFKELAIANGEFWTFFGQQEVKDFGSKVTEVLAAIKKLGFETIQTWKEVASAANAATSAANAANSAVKSSGGSSGGGSSSGSTPSKPAPAPAPVASGPSQASLNKNFQQWLKTTLTNLGYTTMAKKLIVDGAIGPASKNAATTAAKHSRTPSAMDNVLNSVARGNKITESMLSTLKRNTLIKAGQSSQGTTYTSGGNKVQMYANGGKVDYTGPAQVHGSKSKPEYVFNYAQFKDLAKMIAKHELTMPNLKNAQTAQPIQINIERFIDVQGSVDKNTLPELQKMSDNAISQLTNKLKGWGR